VRAGLVSSRASGHAPAQPRNRAVHHTSISVGVAPTASVEAGGCPPVAPVAISRVSLRPEALSVGSQAGASPPRSSCRCNVASVLEGPREAPLRINFRTRRPLRSCFSSRDSLVGGPRGPPPFDPPAAAPFRLRHLAQHWAHHLISMNAHCRANDKNAIPYAWPSMSFPHLMKSASVLFCTRYFSGARTLATPMVMQISQALKRKAERPSDKVCDPKAW